jgi:hypothetical protein
LEIVEPIKPIEKIAEKFELSKESAKYYLGQVQKAFKTEKPPHKLIVDFIDAQELDSLPLAAKLALMMKENNVWAHELTNESQPDPLESDETLPKHGRGTNRKTRPSYREPVSHEKLCPHGIPRSQTCAECEFETFLRLTQSE